VETFIFCSDVFNIMVYFLSDVEQKYVIMNLRPKIRQNPVPDELRGWNWHSPPVKCYYDVRLPMYLICSSYCPTGRDVYLSLVERVPAEESFQVRLGRAVHRSVAEAVLRAKRLDFEAAPGGYGDESIQRAVEMVWEYTLSACKSAFLRARAAQPYATDEDVVATALPFLVEHRLDGSLVGSSGVVSVDCYDYLRNIVFDLKVGQRREEARLYATGYALVLESLYEIPVDIGCTVYLSFARERMSVVRDVYHIDANLRSAWIEERDRKAEMVYSESDPGKPERCPERCMYRGYCG